MTLLKYKDFRKQFKAAMKQYNSFAIALDLSLTDATSIFNFVITFAVFSNTRLFVNFLKYCSSVNHLFERYGRISKAEFA